MKQRSFATTGFELVTKRTRKRELLDDMNLVIPWSDLVGLIEPHAPPGKTGRPPFALETMQRIHILQQLFGLSDPAMEQTLHDVPLYCEFAQLDAGITRLPGESTSLRFRHLLEANQLSSQLFATSNATLATRGLLLKTGTVVDATLIAAPSSTKNSTGNLLDMAELLKASIRAKVEHPFRVLKCQFGFTKVRYKGLDKNTARLITLFALSNLWMVRKRLIQGDMASVRLKCRHRPTKSQKRQPI